MVDVQGLPAMVREIADHVGLEPALALVAAAGGAPALKVPASADTKTGQWLVEIMGVEAATTLIRVYEGNRIGIPRCNALRKAVRDSVIIAQYTAGARVVDLVARYGLTERQLRNIFKTSPAVTLPPKLIERFLSAGAS